VCERHGAGVGTAIQHLFGPGTALPRFEPTPPVKPTRRLKLWELEERLHCPVVGTCLKLEDIKKIARKGGFTGSGFRRVPLARRGGVDFLYAQSSFRGHAQAARPEI
jgi:hypothetical protein